MRLETERLVLRTWREDDVDAFWELHRHPDVLAYLPGPNDRAETAKLVDRFLDHWARHGFGLFAVDDKSSGELVGFTGLIAIEWEAPVKGVEIGWRFRRDVWGQGYATEAARRCLPLAFEQLGIDPLVAIAVPENVRSHRVMERLGFVRQPNKNFEHPRLPEGHRLRLHWSWELTRAAWLKAARSNGP